MIPEPSEQVVLSEQQVNFLNFVDNFVNFWRFLHASLNFSK